MSDKQTGQTAAPVKAQVLEKIRPTLFIALGGTGMKVSIRLRRRILNAVWAGNSKVQQIADFPIAQFINLDLDSGDVTQDGPLVPDVPDQVRPAPVLADDPAEVPRVEGHPVVEGGPRA